MRASVSTSSISSGPHNVFYQCGVAAHLPDRATSCELADEFGLGFGEPGMLDGGGDLVGGLAQDDLGGRVGDEALGDLGGGGAVVGLGGQITGRSSATRRSIQATSPASTPWVIPASRNSNSNPAPTAIMVP
jgi:hypothetical protein